MKVGIDIEDVSRFLGYDKDKTKLNKIFTQKEQEYFAKFKEKATHIAGAFCAKEAVSKALKVGFYKSLSPLDIEILHDERGEPYIVKNEKISKLLSDKEIDISISHTKKQAVAICVIG